MKNIKRRGFGLDLLDKIQNQGTIHQSLICELEKKFKRNIIFYISFFPHPAGIITDEDSTLIENMLKSIDLNLYNNTLDLIIHSPGVIPTAAEKIVLTCRSYAKNGFRVIIPKTAMSAATLVAMGSDTIIMSETSELGPIDPQMVITIGPNQQIVRPAASYVDAYTNLINKIQECMTSNPPLPPHPYIEMLKKIDPVWIEICLKARALARTIAKDFLKEYMLNKKSEEEINAIINHFLKIGEETSHGRTIRALKAKNFGLNINILEQNSDENKLIWELYMRCERYVQNEMLAKYILGRIGGINVQVKAVPILL